MTAKKLPSSNIRKMESKSTVRKIAPRGVFGFSLLVGVICGVAAVRCDITAAIVFFLAITGCVSFFYGRRFGILALAAGLAGVAAAKLQLSNDQALDPSYQEVIVRLVDTNLTSIRELPSPTFIFAELRQNETEFPVAVRLPRGTRAPDYGTLLRGFAEISPPPDPDSSFGRFYAAHRLRGIVRFHAFREIGKEKGALGKLLEIRDRLLQRFAASTDSDDARSIGAALLFGVRSGMRGELRRKFVDAGTVHLFSVSGMHVAVLAAILLVVLRFCPQKIRYFSVIALLGIYTLMTGANSPAVRAFFLIAAWATCRALLYETPAIEVLGVVGATMLLADPALIGDVGAQYSFFITALLLAAGEFRRRRITAAPTLLMTAVEKRRFLQHHRWRMIFPETLFFCAIAFAGSIGITLFSGNDLRPGSIVANLLFSAGAVPLFAVGLIALAASSTGSLFGSFLLAAMHWCEACGELFPAWSYTAPAAWQVALYALALLLGFFAVDLRVRHIAWATAALLLFFWLFHADTMPDAVAFFQGDGNTSPALVIVESRFHRATCINLPDFRAEAELEKFLRQRGVKTIESVYLTQNRRRNCGCLALLPSAFRPKRLIAAPGKISADLVSFLEEHARSNDLEAAPGNRFCRIFPDKTGFSLDYFLARDNVNVTLALHDGDAGRVLDAAIDGKAWFRTTRKWAKKPKVWSFDVPEQ